MVGRVSDHSEEKEMIQRLFVYGTLVPGGPNEHVLSDIGGTWIEASVNGHQSQFSDLRFISVIFTSGKILYPQHVVSVI